MITVKIEKSLNGNDSINIATGILEQFKKVETISEDVFKKILEAARNWVEDNIQHGRDIYGNPVKALSPLTIKKKGHAIPFYQTGKLYNAVKCRMVTNKEGIIELTPERRKIGYWLNKGGGKLPQRKFIGVSENLIKVINTVIQESYIGK